jgi:hypothetical protein
MINRSHMDLADSPLSPADSLIDLFPFLTPRQSISRVSFANACLTLYSALEQLISNTTQSESSRPTNLRRVSDPHAVVIMEVDDLRMSDQNRHDIPEITSISKRLKRQRDESFINLATSPSSSGCKVRRLNDTVDAIAKLRVGGVLDSVVERGPRSLSEESVSYRFARYSNSRRAKEDRRPTRTSSMNNVAFTTHIPVSPVAVIQDVCLSEESRNFVASQAKRKGYTNLKCFNPPLEYTRMWCSKRKELETNISFIRNGGLRDGDLSEFRALACKILETAEWLCAGDLKCLGLHVPVWIEQEVLVSEMVKYDTRIDDMIVLRDGKQAVVSSMDQLNLLLKTKTESYGESTFSELLTTSAFNRCRVRI